MIHQYEQDEDNEDSMLLEVQQPQNQQPNQIPVQNNNTQPSMGIPNPTNNTRSNKGINQNNNRSGEMIVPNFSECYLWDWVCPLKVGCCCSELESGLVADFAVIGLPPAWNLHYPHPAHINGSSHH